MTQAHNDTRVPTFRVKLGELIYENATDTIKNFDAVTQIVQLYRAYKMRDDQGFYTRATDELLAFTRLTAPHPTALRKLRRQWLLDNGVSLSLIRHWRL